MGSITGLTTGNFTSVNNAGELRVGPQVNSGTAGQALVSGGPNQPTRWDTHTGIINPLTMGTDLSLASGAATFDGSVADTINAAGHGFGTGGNGIDITGTTITTDNDGTTITNALSGANQVLKVPNALTAGTAISFNVGTTYDGATAVTINATDTNTTYTAGDNLDLTPGNVFSLEQSIEDMNDIEYESGFYDSTLMGNDYPSKPTVATYLDLSSSTNIQALPQDVYDVSGAFRLTINLANFMSNDDSTFYNIFAEDDLSGKIHGAIKPANAVVEMVGYFIVPSGFTATAVRCDITDDKGAAITRTLTFESFTTYGATSFSALGTGTSGSEQSFSSNLVGASDKLLMIRINTTATSDHVRGGYILLTR